MLDKGSMAKFVHLITKAILGLDRIVALTSGSSWRRNRTPFRSLSATKHVVEVVPDYVEGQQHLHQCD